ncbi:MAG: Rieske 2Fe-2S domain-containing protein [Rhodospirillales bacterium]|nr:MAG: Rieske 2Fe-2S domain-containing protein [Rhodospirillales bacterium]
MGVPYAALVHEDRVHGSLYTDPAVFAEEMDRVFRRGWVFVGHESEIPAAGDWVARRIGLEPVLMTRDGSGAVHALANRCAHRGNRLCVRERGNAKAFQCAYHGWTFGLDGALRSVPFVSGFDGDRAALGLDRPGAVDSHRGFVFANISGDAGPLAAHLGSAGRALLDRLCDLSPTGALRFDAGWIGHRIDSNWKMWPESDNDGYHLDFVHASMLRAADSYYKETVVGGEKANASLAVDHGGGHVELDMRPSYKGELSWLGSARAKVSAYCDALTARLGAARAAAALHDGPPHAFIFPNLFLGELNIARIEPLGVGATVHHHTVVQFDGVDAAFNRRLLRQSEAALGPASFIVPDDAVVAERMQMSFAGATADSGNGGALGWIDLTRGRARETRGAGGSRVGHISDETTNRGFWRHYRQVMEARA